MTISMIRLAIVQAKHGRQAFNLSVILVFEVLGRSKNITCNGELILSDDIEVLRWLSEFGPLKVLAGYLHQDSQRHPISSF